MVQVENERMIVEVEEAANPAEKKASGMSDNSGEDDIEKTDETRNTTAAEAKKNLFAADAENSEGAFADF